MLVPDIGGPSWPPAAGAAAFLQMQGGYLQAAQQFACLPPQSGGFVGGHGDLQAAQQLAVQPPQSGGFVGGPGCGGFNVDGMQAQQFACLPPQSGGFVGGHGCGGFTGDGRPRPQKWPRKEDIPVPQLDLERQMGIQKLLQDAGGVLPLGKVTEIFPGLKRMQLQGMGIFELNKVGNDGQFEVRLPGYQSTGAEIMFQGQPLSKEQQLPDLDAESMSRIRLALEMEPGFTLPMAKVKEIVPGVNKRQLEKDFDVIRVDKKHFNVALRQGGESGTSRLGDQWRAIFRLRFGAFGALAEDPAAKRLRTA